MLSAKNRNTTICNYYGGSILKQIFIISCFILSAVLLLSGCTYYDKNQSNDHRNLTVTDTSDQPWRTSNVSQSERQNFLNGKNTGTNEQKNETQQPTIFTDTDLENNLLDMEEVIDTNVIISNNNAFVAVVLQQRQKLTSKMKNQITNQVKKNHPQINHVYISENPHFIQQMSEFSTRLKRGDQNVMDDFNQMLNDYFTK